jgi:hypothetical protein
MKTTGDILTYLRIVSVRAAVHVRRIGIFGPGAEKRRAQRRGRVGGMPSDLTTTWTGSIEDALSSPLTWSCRHGKAAPYIEQEVVYA